METNIEMAVVPEKNYKIVSDPAISRKLLRDGFHLADIKPKKNNRKETVFIFEVEGDFIEKMEQYIRERKDKSVDK